MTSHYQGRRDFRTPRPVLLMVVAAELIFLAGALLTLLTGGWTWVSVCFVGFAVIGLGGIVESLMSRIVLADDAMLVTTLRGSQRYARTEIIGVEEAKGCPTAIRLAAGRWVKLPGVGTSVGNSIRAWLRAMPLLLLACVPGRAQAAPELPDPHHHVVPVHAAPWENDLAPDARMVRLDERIAGVDSVLSPDRRWRAFVIESDADPGVRVCVEAVRGRTRYELLDLPLPYRNIDDLVWLDADHLAFDRWSQPHHGVHYVLDVRRRRLVLSAEFPDEFALRPQAPERR